MRLTYLKGYIFALLAEGEFKGVTSPVIAMQKAVAIFAKDLPQVIGEIAEMAAQQGGHRVTAAVLGSMNDIVKDIGKRGFKAVWSDLQSLYSEGIKANSAARRR